MPTADVPASDSEEPPTVLQVYPVDVWMMRKIHEEIEIGYEELRRMAEEGELRRRDFVKPAGKMKWKRAGRIADLWPASLGSDDSLLTTCGVCNGQVAKEATQCPKCGAPNRWIHPEIARFMNRLARFRRDYDGFEVETKGYVICGRSVRRKQFLDYRANAVGSLGFAGPLNLSGLALTFGASIGKQYAAEALRDAAGRDVHAFVFDFRFNPPHWSTTDDEFWEEVIDLGATALPTCDSWSLNPQRSLFCIINGSRRS